MVIVGHFQFMFLIYSLKYFKNGILKTRFKSYHAKPVSKIQGTTYIASRNQKKVEQMATQRDREILNAIVNPLLPVGEAVFDDADQIPVTLLDEEVDNTEEYK